MSSNQQTVDPINLVDGEESGGGNSANLFEFAEDCVSSIISLTSPRDACIIACVSKLFLSAARSDVVWDKFLPDDCLSLVPPSLSWSSKKELYFALSDNHVLIDGGRKSFWLDKYSGKKCYMLSARSLEIAWGDTEQYWVWVPLPESRFPEIADLVDVCWLEIRGKMNTQLLSPETKYSAYLVFKIQDWSRGILRSRVEVGIAISGKETNKKDVWLDVKDGEGVDVDNEGHHLKKRRDGWMEIELGEFFTDGVADEEVEMSVMEIKGGHWKSGLGVQGIEVRPKGPN